jgi:hypothetical protein
LAFTIYYRGRNGFSANTKGVAYGVPANLFGQANTAILAGRIIGTTPEGHLQLEFVGGHACQEDGCADFYGKSTQCFTLFCP